MQVIAQTLNGIRLNSVEMLICFIINFSFQNPAQTSILNHRCNPFQQIYDLSQDALSPLYYFLLPSGKIRDVSFIFDDGDHSLILMSSGGQLYLQPMDANSSAINGPFYLTNTVSIEHPDLQDSNGQVAGGGVSVYYSHILQLIFFSYSQGTVCI